MLAAAAMLTAAAARGAEPSGAPAARAAPDVVRPAEPAWIAPEPAREPERRPLRATLQTGIALAVASGWYWWNVDLNALDWDLRWDRASWERKLTSLDTLRFDSNYFETNAVSHPRSGTILFHIGRSNGLGVGGSVLSTAAATTLWEYVGEFRELPSINDLVVNPVAGLAIGEPLFQIGELFRRSSDAFGYQVLAALATPVTTLNDATDGRRRRPRDPVDGLGISRAVWHRFALQAGMDNIRHGRAGPARGVGLALDAEVVSQPGYLRPDRFAAWIEPGAWSGIGGGLAIGEPGLHAGDFASHAVFAGRYAQRMRRDDLGRTVGSATMVGLASAFSYTWRAPPGEAEDVIASLGIVGPRAELVTAGASHRLRLRAQATADLGMLVPHGATLDPGRAMAGGTKTALRTRGYYFAGGTTLLGGGAVELGPWDLFTEARWNLYESIEGLDRFQEQIRDDFHLSDRRLSLGGGLGFRSGWFRLGAAVERVERSGTMSGRERETIELRVRGTVTLVL